MSKIGAHVSGHPRFTFRSFLRAKPAAILGLDDSDIFPEIDEENGGHSWKIYRTTTVYSERPSDLHNPPGTYSEMAYYWYYEASPSLKEVYDRNRKADFYIPDNEPTGGESEIEDDIRQNCKNVVAYERELMYLMNADDKKMGVLALAGGSPGDFQIWIDICVPFIKEAFDSGNAYVRHAYEGNWDRVYKEAQYLLDNNLGYGPMFVTEWGFNGGYGQSHDAQKIRDEDQLLMAYPNVVSFLLWEYGKTQFNANIDHIVPQITPYMEMRPTEKWKWTDPDPPPVDPPPEEETFKQKAWRITSEMQKTLQGGIQLNPAAGIQGQIEKDSRADDLSLQIVTSETTVDGLVVQAAESRTNKVGRRNYVYDPWVGVWWYGDPDSENQLSVEPLSQRDPRWFTDSLGQQTGHNKTIGNYGCLLVVYNMQARYLNLTGFLPDEFNPFMVQSGAFKDQYLRSGALQMAYPDQITYQDYMRREDDGFLKTIRLYLDDSLFVPCRVDFRPSTETWEEHWVLLIGYTVDDFYMADPWTGEIGLVSEVYDISGDDILEALFYRLKKAPVKIDLKPYIIGDGRRYYLKNKNGTTQEILQCQEDRLRFFQVKNTAWESFIIDANWIRRDKDTSPGGNRYYTQREGYQPARWLPRTMAIGEEFTVSLRVQFYTLADCKPSAPNSGDVTDTRKLVVHHKEWTSRHGIKLHDVIEIQWVNGKETYLYARNYGLVEWSRGHSDPNSPEWTSISELVLGGNNTRMSGCFS